MILCKCLNMKSILLLLFSISSFVAIAQSQMNAKNLAGKIIYCFKMVDKNNAEGAKSSFSEPNSYPYLQRIELNKNGSYKITNELRESSGTGKYKLTATSIVLTTAVGSKTNYEVIFQGDKYVTLKSGSTLHYCLID